MISQKSEPEGVAVETETVARSTVIETVTATGKIQPMTQVNISADVSAKITRLAVQEGDWVDKGALLLELDRERYVAAVESAQASLSSALATVNLAKENMIKAEKDYERTRQLHESSLESEATLDSSYAAAEVEKARHQSMLDQAEQARAALKQARDDLSKTTIYAPMSGTVSKLEKEEGEIALGSQFQEDVIMVISNLEGMEALVDVDENDIVSVATTDSASIEVDALPDQRFAGAVTEIANSAKVSGEGTTDQKTEFEVKIAITEPGSTLRPGMTASAEITTEVRENVIAVPIQCVTVRTLEQIGEGLAGEAAAGDSQPPQPEESSPVGAPGEKQAPARFTPDEEGFVELVWVARDGKAEARQVRTGIQGETHIEILEGLEEGEEVVAGSFRAISRDLRDGSAIRAGSAEAGS
jgi:HlyD family secretion protein